MGKKLLWYKAMGISCLSFGLFFIILLQDAQAQEMTVTGTVLYNPEMNACLKEVPCFDAVEFTKEEDWIPTPGAVNIVVKGTGRVAKTDREGNYEIAVPSQNDTLIFLYLSHNRVEIPIGGREVVDVKLTPTPLPVIDRLLGFIMPKVVEGIYPDLDSLAEKADVNRATARAIMWLVLGNKRMGRIYPEEYIPDFQFDED